MIFRQADIFPPQLKRKPQGLTQSANRECLQTSNTLEVYSISIVSLLQRLEVQEQYVPRLPYGKHPVL